MRVRTLSSQCRLIFGRLVCALLYSMCGFSASVFAEPVATAGDDPHSVRFGVSANLTRYPQDTPEATIRSVTRAARQGETTYLLAHLIYPPEVDLYTAGRRDRLQELANRTSEARRRSLERSLQLQLEKGVWKSSRRLAVGEAPGLPPIRLRRIGLRWYLVNAAGGPR